MPTHRDDVAAVLSESGLTSVPIHESGLATGELQELRKEMQALLNDDPLRQKQDVSPAVSELLGGFADGIQEFLDAVPNEVASGDKLYYIHVDIATALDTRSRIKPIAARHGLSARGETLRQTG